MRRFTIRACSTVLRAAPLAPRVAAPLARATSTPGRTLPTRPLVIGGRVAARWLSVAADYDPDGARKMVDEGALLLDVRTPEEHAEGTFGNAANISHDILAGTPEGMEFVHKLTGNDKSRPIVVYCRAGRRSEVAKQALQFAGYTTVVNLGGLGEAGAAFAE